MDYCRDNLCYGILKWLSGEDDIKCTELCE